MRRNTWRTLIVSRLTILLHELNILLRCCSTQRAICRLLFQLFFFRYNLFLAPSMGSGVLLDRIEPHFHRINKRCIIAIEPLRLGYHVLLNSGELLILKLLELANLIPAGLVVK